MISLLCIAWWAAALAILLGSTAAALIEPWFRTERREPVTLPVSVIVPMRDFSPAAGPALASLFTQSYPEFEVLVSATEEPSPALEQARAVASRYPHIPAHFIVRNPRAADNPKINNLALPIAAARYDLIAIKDSNIRLNDGRLAEMAGCFAAGAGLVVSVPVGMEPENFPAEIECAAMNGYVGRFLLAASLLGMGFGIGAAMMFSRRDFERAGGIARIAQAVGEDHAISKMLAGIGRKTAIEGTVEQIIGTRRFLEMWNRQLRWAVCRRCEAPLFFHAELLASPLAAAFAGAAGAGAVGFPVSGIFLATVVTWTAAEILLAACKGWPLSWRSPFAALCFIFFFPALWLQARFVRRIFWGDVPFTVGKPAKNAGVA